MYSVQLIAHFSHIIILTIIVITVFVSVPPGCSCLSNETFEVCVNLKKAASQNMFYS